MNPRLCVVNPTRRAVHPLREPHNFTAGLRLPQMHQNLLDNCRILDAGNDPYRPAARQTGLDVNAKYPFQTLRPSR